MLVRLLLLIGFMFSFGCRKRLRRAWDRSIVLRVMRVLMNVVKRVMYRCIRVWHLTLRTMLWRFVLRTRLSVVLATGLLSRRLSLLSASRLFLRLFRVAYWRLVLGFVWRFGLGCLRFRLTNRGRRRTSELTLRRRLRWRRSSLVRLGSRRF